MEAAETVALVIGIPYASVGSKLDSSSCRSNGLSIGSYSNDNNFTTTDLTITSITISRTAISAVAAASYANCSNSFK